MKTMGGRLYYFFILLIGGRRERSIELTRWGKTGIWAMEVAEATCFGDFCFQLTRRQRKSRAKEGSSSQSPPGKNVFLNRWNLWKSSQGKPFGAPVNRWTCKRPRTLCSMGMWTIQRGKSRALWMQQTIWGSSARARPGPACSPDVSLEK